MTDKHSDAAEALETIRRSQAAVHDKVGAGGWTYDIVYSLLVGGMVASVGLPMPLFLVVDGLCALSLGLMAWFWARRTGVWVSGLTPPRARWVAIGLGAAFVTLMVSGLVLVHWSGIVWASAALGGIAAVVALIGSRLWMRVYRAETRGEG